jgi:hypothetical protein
VPDPEDKVANVSVVVVHGVGDQVAGNSAKELTVSLGKYLAADVVGTGHGVELNQLPSLIYSDNVVDSGDGTSDSYAVTMDGRIGTRAYRINEFFWADLSRNSETIWQRSVGAVRAILGLPELGRLALSSPEQESTWLTATARFFYMAGVRLILLRALMVIALLVISFKNRNDVLLITDWVIDAVLLMFGLALFATVLKGRGKSRNAATTAVLSLTVTFVLLSILPEAVGPRLKKKPPPHPVNVSRLYTFPVADQPQPVTADWFYSPQTFPGICPYVGLALIAVWLLIFIVRYCTIRRASGSDPASTTNLLRLSLIMWIAIAILLLVVQPVFDLENLGSLLLFKTTPYWLADSGTSEEKVISAACDIIFYAFAASAGLILFSPKLRVVLNTILEFTDDVIAYLVKKRLFGPPHPLSQSLHVRLSILLNLIAQRDGRAPVVVAHSLGSVIAARAAFAGAPMSALITMGSPMNLLFAAYPQTFAAWFDGQAPASFKNVRWVNLYCSGDLIGRDICDNVSSIVMPHSKNVNLPIGNGGHVGYFTSICVADQIDQISSATK